MPRRGGSQAKPKPRLQPGTQPTLAAWSSSALTGSMAAGFPARAGAGGKDVVRTCGGVEQENGAERFATVLCDAGVVDSHSTL